MKRIAFLVLSIAGLFLWMGAANGKESGRLFRDDCHLSFLVPSGLEYFEVGDVITTGKDECYIAFKYTGDARAKSVGTMPAMPDDWRTMTDFSLTVKRISLEENLAKIESDDGLSQHDTFNLISKEHMTLPNGGLYILKYLAKNQTGKMTRLHQSRMVIFVAGNSDYSISYPLYSGVKLTILEKKRWEIFRRLFLSIDFSGSR